MEGEGEGVPQENVPSFPLGRGKDGETLSDGEPLVHGDTPHALALRMHRGGLEFLLDHLR